MRIAIALLLLTPHALSQTTAAGPHRPRGLSTAAFAVEQVSPGLNNGFRTKSPSTIGSMGFMPVTTVLGRADNGCAETPALLA